jgi:transcriptional regulator of arginine metabolism
VSSSPPPAPRRGHHQARRERHGAILRLIRERPISTQTELAEALHETGYDVVQTTVSRDIAELGLVKVRAANGRLVYAPAGTTNGDRYRELGLALRRWALSFEASGSLVVVLTPRGYATPLADAIDDAGHPDVIGTVAGENTILVVAREGVPGAELRDELRHHLMEGAA